MSDIKEHDAYVINVNGSDFNLKPTLERSCHQTRLFATYSSETATAGGISIVISNEVSQEAIEKAILILTCIGNDKFGRDPNT